MKKQLLAALAFGAISTMVPLVAAPQGDGTPRTADNQKNNKSDLNLTQTIRKDIMADKSLSTAAHNVKIISENGQVTLRGDVNSDTEKEAVLAIAKKDAGTTGVQDQVTVKPPKR